MYTPNRTDKQKDIHPMDECQLTAPRYYSTTKVPEPNRELVACMHNPQTNCIEGVVYDPKDKSFNLYEEYADTLLHDMGKDPANRSPELNAIHTLGRELYALGHGQLFVLAKEDGLETHPLLAYNPLHAIYWVGPYDRWIMVDARAYRNLRNSHNQNVEFMLRNRFPKMIHEPKVVVTQRKDESPLAKTYVTELRVQTNCAKIKFGRGVIKRYDLPKWYREFLADVGRTPGATIGGIYRKLNNGKLKVEGCKMFIINNGSGELMGAVLSLQYNKHEGQSFAVPSQSIQMYVDLTKRLGSADDVFNYVV